jgi:hypothetical protein
LADGPDPANKNAKGELLENAASNGLAIAASGVVVSGDVGTDSRHKDVQIQNDGSDVFWDVGVGAATAPIFAGWGGNFS